MTELAPKELDVGIAEAEPAPSSLVPRTIKNPRLKRHQRLYGLPTVIIPHVGVLLALVQLARGQVGLLEPLLLVGMYIPTMFGINVGYHRYFTHLSFKARSGTRALLAILGSMTAQGPIINWVSNHRRHHKHSEHVGDPHSPYMTDSGQPLRGLRGFWHAHVGWLFDGEVTNAVAFSKDLLRDPLISAINRTYLLWVAVGLVIPALIGGLVTMSAAGALQGFLWGGLARVALGQNSTWSVGSLAHIFGRQDFATKEQSRNNFVLALLILGEGWHNNHHAFPTAAIVQFKWWQIDVSGWVILALGKLGLAWDIRGVPAAARLESRRLQQG